MDESAKKVNQSGLPEAAPRESENSRSATHMARFMGRLKMHEAEGIAASDMYRRMLACIQADLMRYCVRLGERALDAFEKRPSDEDTVNHVKTFLAGLRRIRQFAQVSMTMDQKRHSPRAKAAEPINDKHLATGARDHALK